LTSQALVYEKNLDQKQKEFKKEIDKLSKQIKEEKAKF